MTNIGLHKYSVNFNITSISDSPNSDSNPDLKYREPLYPTRCPVLILWPPFWMGHLKSIISIYFFFSVTDKCNVQKIAHGGGFEVWTSGVERYL